MELKASEGSGRIWLVALFGGWLAGSLLTGCAFSQTPVKVAFSPSVAAPLNGVRKESLEVGEIKDNREVAGPNVLLHKSNQYGATSGAYVTEKPVATIFRDGLVSVLAQNGFISTNAVHLELRGELQSYGIGVIQNFLSANTAKPWLSVRFELIDKATGLPVWHDTFSGRSTEAISSWALTDEDLITKSFSEVAQDAIKQLVADPLFRSHFE